MSPQRSGTVIALAEAVAAGEMSASDLVGGAVDRLRSADSTYHVVAHPMYETALDRARAADDAVARGDALGPLHGIPIGVKDLYDVAGEPTAAGSTILGGSVAEHTATAVQNLQDAGAIVVAKLTMTEFAGTTHNEALPTPVNPYDAGRSPAGSSSGSAVSVAAGLLPVVLGSDTVASIRMPAAWNGCVGFKPSYGRVSRHGVFALAATYDHCGPLTRTVADADLVARVMAGHDPLDLTTPGDCDARSAPGSGADRRPTGPSRP
jgi:Asp-tRNA(Asn)/Glu-tRNA(Gln) amidotransferase A subunit family amidase